mmetsp:Transcript_27992/g.53281  ORF Transcript_27992/g.53281 Transcript_27992/m.53281 type:complete len:256 (+) Transcript_27992:191-958(+)
MKNIRDTRFGFIALLLSALITCSQGAAVCGYLKENQSLFDAEVEQEDLGYAMASPGAGIIFCTEVACPSNYEVAIYFDGTREECLEYFSKEIRPSDSISGMNDNKDACRATCDELVKPELVKLGVLAKDEASLRTSEYLQKACENFANVYIRKLKVFSFLKWIAQSVASWCCEQVVSIGTEILGEKIDEVVGDSITDAVDEAYSKIVDVVCSVAKSSGLSNSSTSATVLTFPYLVAVATTVALMAISQVCVRNQV